MAFNILAVITIGFASVKIEKKGKYSKFVWFDLVGPLKQYHQFVCLFIVLLFFRGHPEVWRMNSLMSRCRGVWWCLPQYSLDCGGYVEFAQARSGKLPRVNVGNFRHGGVDVLQIICLHDQHRLSGVEVELRWIKRVWVRVIFIIAGKARERSNESTHLHINEYEAVDLLMSKDSQMNSEDIIENRIE